MDDKFIMMGLNDDKAGKIAEILKNKSAKKILNFLGDVKEASETDISQGLKIPLNTVEYNLKKLVNAGFVKKSRNFFWSRRGKKIPMYALAKKHIVISPAKLKPSASALRAVLPILGVAVIGLFIALLVFNGGSGPVVVDDTLLNQFDSYSDLKSFVSENVQDSGGILKTFTESQTAGVATASSEVSADDFSETNIQVAGVDEADIVKNDGKYVYVVSGAKIVIVDAYPAENMKKLSEIKLDEKHVSEIFINGDKLVVFARGYSSVSKCSSKGGCYGGSYISFVNVYDISDKENVVLENDISYDGNYVDSRMIGDYVYVVFNKYVNVQDPQPPVYKADGVTLEVVAEDVYYFNHRDTGYTFNSIMALDVDSGDFETKTYLMGSSYNIYVSEDNIYLTYTKYVDYIYKLERMVEDVYVVLMPDMEGDFEEILSSDKQQWEKGDEINEIVRDYSTGLIGDVKGLFDEELYDKLNEFEIEFAKESEKTVIHKVGIAGMDIDYEGVGEVSGRILNQFSMDEYKGNFRIATTTGNTWQETSFNHLYVLDDDLEIIGSVEDLAKGERIYSARFMGEKAYLVTFRQIDPFYVIDLSDAESPKVLGYLKIPGYSSYLHPYGDDKVIGIGKDGSNLKLSLFDVSDVENPVEIDKFVVEGDYSNSEALDEHKAFLFSEDKGLLVIPVHYWNYEVYDVTETGVSYRDYKYWQGVFVFDVNGGFSLKGKIANVEDGEDYHNTYWLNNVRRSLYMDDYLYTVSNSNVRASDLDSLDEIGVVDWEYDDQGYVFTGSA